MVCASLVTSLIMTIRQDSGGSNQPC